MPATPDHDCVSLQELICSCHEDNGYLQVIVGLEEMICLQLVRGQPDLMPTAQSDSENVQWQAYCIRSGVIHRGRQAEAGHFQALLLEEQQALLVDYEQRPQPGQILNLAPQDLCLLWLTPSSTNVQRPSQQQTVVAMPEIEVSGSSSQKGLVHESKNRDSMHWESIIADYF